MDITWKNPPMMNARSPKKRPGPDTKYEDVANKLRENPGRWAMFTEAATTGLAHRIKFGVLRGFEPSGSFEATVRDVNPSNQEATIYVRFVGENGEYK